MYLKYLVSGGYIFSASCACTPLKTVYSESLRYIMCLLLPNVGFRVAVQGEIITVSCVRPCSSGKPNDGILLADLTKACPCQLLQIGECCRETAEVGFYLHVP